MNPLEGPEPPEPPERRVHPEKSDATVPDSTVVSSHLVRLSAMVIKTGLGLGLMSGADRRLALALPALASFAAGSGTAAAGSDGNLGTVRPGLARTVAATMDQIFMSSGLSGLRTKT